MKKPTKKEVLAKIKNNIKINENGCHIWQGSVNSSGHPQMRVGDKIEVVHRLLKRCPKNKVISRSCGNKRCVNKDHLIAVPFSHTCRSKTFDYSLLKEIRRKYYEIGNYTHRSLAKEYKVSSAFICKILNQ